MRIKRIAAYAAIYFLWGGSYLAIRYVVAVVPPFFTAGVRYTLGALILTFFSLVIKRESFPSRKQTMNAIATGIALLTFSYGVVYWAETSLSSSMVAVLMSTIFLWTYLGECILRAQRLRGKMLLPLLAGLIGMPLLLQATLIEGHARSLIAGAAVLFGACLWAATLLAIKRIELPQSYVQTAALQLGASGFSFFLLSFVSGELSKFPPMDQVLSPKPIAGMIYLVLASSALAFAAFQWLLANEPAYMVATSSYVNPLVAMALGILIAHETWSRTQLLGAAVILGSIVFIWHGRKPVAIRRPEVDSEVPATNVLTTAEARFSEVKKKGTAFGRITVLEERNFDV